MLEEDKDEGAPGGVGGPHRSAEPGLIPVQVHFEEESAKAHDFLPCMHLTGADLE